MSIDSFSPPGLLLLNDGPHHFAILLGCSRKYPFSKDALVERDKESRAIVSALKSTMGKIKNPASCRQRKGPYKDVFRFNVSVDDIQWVQMLKCRTNVLGEPNSEFFPLSSIFVFFEQHFKIPSRHKFHHNRQLILNRNAFNDLHNFGVLCFPEETNAEAQNVK